MSFWYTFSVAMTIVMAAWAVIDGLVFRNQVWLTLDLIALVIFGFIAIMTAPRRER